MLSLVAANSTALTSTTPVGATSKITQLFYGMIRPGDIKSNLATAGITAEIVSNSSNLLMDIKPGYMLGAKPRQQAIGHIIGILSGSLASTFLFFVLFTKGIDPKDPSTVANLQSDMFPMPSVTVWMGVAKILTEGFHKLPSSVVMAVIVASITGLVLEILRIASKNKFPISPVAIGPGIRHRLQIVPVHVHRVTDLLAAGCRSNQGRRGPESLLDSELRASLRGHHRRGQPDGDC